eukprot:5449397-Karenia_brevis.AAC.1
MQSAEEIAKMSSTSWPVSPTGQPVGEENKKWYPQLNKTLPTCLLTLVLWMAPMVEEAMLQAPALPDLH